MAFLQVVGFLGNLEIFEYNKYTSIYHVNKSEITSLQDYLSNEYKLLQRKALGGDINTRNSWALSSIL